MSESKKENEFNDKGQRVEDTDREVDDVELERDQEFSEYSARANKDIVADLRAKLKKSNEEKDEYLLGWQKAKADFINARKQDQEANRLMVKFAEAGIVSELVPILVSLDLAFADADVLANVPPDWKNGIEQIRNKLLAVLSLRNIEVIDPINKPFDPGEAEAVGMIDTDKPSEDHVVLSVLQKGYRLHDRVISPAKVRVGRYTEK